MYCGTGLYSLPEASRLAGVPSRDINRWLFGYHYFKTVGDDAVRTDMQPLWKTEHSLQDYDEKVIGFRDLIELRFVHEFVRHGVSLQVIRCSLQTASEIYGVSHPMSLPRFMTDGKLIYAEAHDEKGNEASLVDLKHRQTVIKEIIRPTLYDGIVYDAKQERVNKWYPATDVGAGRTIVIDPARQFGAPIVEETGTPTDVLFASYLAEGGDGHALALTARLYEVPTKSVEAAVRFEGKLKRKLH
jgi:uncharacterized protein (DUF433 family)